MNNIPEMKIGIVAVSRDCFPESLSVNRRKAIAEGLSRLLADSYTLYLKTHNFHWNVTGPMFSTLHTMFMDQYTELWNALDEIAERIRALGFSPRGWIW